MVRADDAARAVSARSIEQARRAMAADVVESAHRAVAAAHGEQHLADEVEALVVAGIGNFRDMADHLPGGPENAFAFEREKFRIGVRPRRQTEVVGGEFAHAA